MRVVSVAFAWLSSPLTELPISGLGFDPILSMPSVQDIQESISKRTCPIKALLLDQTFSAGVGNYLADEILYHAKPCIHQIASVCRITVEANADDSRYPDHWLFKHRWGKGKNAQQKMKLPSGELASIKWVTVGGRTSAYVAEVQKLPSKRKIRDIPVEDTGIGNGHRSDTEGSPRKRLQGQMVDAADAHDAGPRRSKRKRGGE
ncbi:hypothetical protein BU15DRAFT_71895 [Melanogaster broomeanus]|nr:hypothetical protein BU15DRAFT_71895 [Melanogaster broomeanus]